MKKILLAEHDEFLINIYANELRRSDYSISIIRDGQTVASRIKDIDPDLLLLDVGLPKIAVISDVKKLKEDSGLNNLKVMLLLDFYDKSQGIFNFSADKYFIKSQTTSKEIVQGIKEILS